MDQIVRKPRPEAEIAIEQALGLDSKGRPSKRNRRRWLYALAALVVARRRATAPIPGSPPMRAAVVYNTVPAAKDSLTVTVSATGTLQPLTQVDISSELSGVVRTVSVNENDLVNKGDVLAELDTTRIARAGRRRRGLGPGRRRQGRGCPHDAEGERADVRARQQQLSKRGMVADQALETATATRDRAASAVKMAEANLAIAAGRAEAAPDRSRKEQDLRADRRHRADPLGRSRPDGRLVAAGAGAVRHRRRPEKHGAEGGDRRGRHRRRRSPARRRASRSTPFPDRSFDALIRDIAYASVTTEGVVTYDARLDVDNAELLLRPGMTATVSVVTREAKDVITVPAPPSASGRRWSSRSRGWSLQSLFMPRMPRGAAAATTARLDRRHPHALRAEGRRAGAGQGQDRLDRRREDRNRVRARAKATRWSSARRRPRQ